MEDSLNTIFYIDESSFQKIFDEYYTPLCRYTARFVNREEIAEEIVQELFIYVWQIRNDLAIHSSLKSFLYTSVRNRAIDYLRTRFAQLKFVDETNAYNFTDNTNIISKIESDELDDFITRSIDNLPEKCGIIFSLKRHSDLTNKEIAEQLNISEKTVENQITIAFRKLRPVLSKYLKLMSILVFS